MTVQASCMHASRQAFHLEATLSGASRYTQTTGELQTKKALLIPLTQTHLEVQVVDGGEGSK
jgi:hypothetical protein